MQTEPTPTPCPLCGVAHPPKEAHNWQLYWELAIARVRRQMQAMRRMEEGDDGSRHT